MIGTVPQAVRIFSGSVLDNLTLRDASVQLEDVVFAARIVGLDHIVRSLPDGYATRLGPGECSCPQVSSSCCRWPGARMGSARAAAGWGAFAIDSASDAAFRAALQALFAQQGKAVLTIAHRLATAQRRVPRNGAGPRSDYRAGRAGRIDSMRAGTLPRCLSWSPPAGIGASRAHSMTVRITGDAATARSSRPRAERQCCLGISRGHVPAVRAVTGVDESGGEARTYAIDDSIILKTQRPHRVRPRTSLEKEVFHLRTLADRASDISVPRVFGYGRDGDIEYTVMSRIPGRALRHVSMSAEVRADLLRELGAILRAIHGLDAQPFRASGLFPGDEDAFDVRARLEADLARAERSAAQLRSEWTLDVTPEDAAARSATICACRPGHRPAPLQPWSGARLR